MGCLTLRSNPVLLDEAPVLVLHNVTLLERAASRLSRADLERLAQHVIDTLDELDGDADLETCGDEADGNGAEDDFVNHVGGDWQWEPGWEISDAS